MDRARRLCGTLFSAWPKAVAPRPLIEFQSRLHCNKFGPKQMSAATTIPPISSIPLSLRSSSSSLCHSLFATASRMPPVLLCSKLRMNTASASCFFLPSHAHNAKSKASTPWSFSLQASCE